MGHTVLVTGGSGFVGSHVVRQVPTRELPNWVGRFASRFDRKLKPLVPLLDSTRRASSAKAQRMLDWHPRQPEEAIVATARSLMPFGVVPDSRR